VLNKLIRSEVLSAHEVGVQAAAKNIPERFASCLAQILEKVHQLPSGRYLLSHARGSPNVCIYQSTSPPTGKVNPPPALDSPARYARMLYPLDSPPPSPSPENPCMVILWKISQSLVRMARA
jgi:hypothetical protein